MYVRYSSKSLHVFLLVLRQEQIVDVFALMVVFESSAACAVGGQRINSIRLSNRALMRLDLMKYDVQQCRPNFFKMYNVHSGTGQSDSWDHVNCLVTVIVHYSLFRACYLLYAQHRLCFWAIGHMLRVTSKLPRAGSSCARFHGGGRLGRTSAAW